MLTGDDLRLPVRTEVGIGWHWHAVRPEREVRDDAAHL